MSPPRANPVLGERGRRRNLVCKMFTGDASVGTETPYYPPCCGADSPAGVSRDLPNHPDLAVAKSNFPLFYRPYCDFSERRRSTNLTKISWGFLCPVASKPQPAIRHGGVTSPRSIVNGSVAGSRLYPLRRRADHAACNYRGGYCRRLSRLCALRSSRSPNANVLKGARNRTPFSFRFDMPRQKILCSDERLVRRQRGIPVAAYALPFRLADSRFASFPAALPFCGLAISTGGEALAASANASVQRVATCEVGARCRTLVRPVSLH